MHQKPVFFDESGRRRLWITVASLVLVLAAVAVVAAFCVSLIVRPDLPPISALSHGKIAPASTARPALAYRSSRQELMRAIRKGAKSVPASGDLISVGFYAPWEETGIASLRAHANRLTHVLPVWLRLGEDGLSLNAKEAAVTPDSANEELLAIAKSHHLKVMPILSNASSTDFQPARVHKLFQTVGAPQRLAKEVASFVLLHHFAGINLDFENLLAVDEAELPSFVTLLKKAMGPNEQVSVDIPAEANPRYLRASSEAADWCVLMAYDEHSESDEPGPIASAEWTKRQLDHALAVIPRQKLVLGMGSYAYDWPETARAAPLTYQEALANANDISGDSDPSKLIDFDDSLLNPTYRYLDDNNKPHEVWMLDAPSDYNAYREGRLRGVRGFALWALGMEDPGVWNFIRPQAIDTQPDFRRVAFPYEVEHSGKGEILRVQSRPSDGERTIEWDAATGLAVDESYTKFPTPYVIRHSGYVPKRLAITFDDGPDPRATPQILKVLKDLHVPATFFVIGEQAERWSELVRQMVADGHEVGSHSFTHPNMGTIEPMRANLELNATQRALQGILGRSTILFRPPYNADSEPRSPAEVRPVDQADRLGYMTVGEKIDPNDWNLNLTDHGVSRPKTARDIADSVERDIASFESKKNEGNVILLHDGGGDRTQTVAALKLLVPELRAKGYKFELISGLIGANRDRVMPPLAPEERLLIACDSWVFGSWFGATGFLQGLFYFALILGFAKVFTVIGLSVYQRKEEKLHHGPIPVTPATGPTVAIAIAAYNEEKVIERTLASVLASEYPLSQVVVVDDGSTDRTLEIARAFALQHPVVEVMSKANGGKASALNHAISRLATDIAVFVDADTLLDAKAIGHLASHFGPKDVAAVAGNVKVGNVRSILGLWQSLEYMSSQNLDRRAYAKLNAITVVPGAIGAWRVGVLREVGGFETDTLAEDMDLTWRALGKGYRITNETRSMAFTEVPESMSAFVRQRFRWAFGTLQCLFKHRSRFFQRSWFSWLVLPCVGLFQFAFQALAPLIDLQVLVSFVRWFASYQSRMETLDSMLAYQATSITLAISLGLALLFFLSEAAATVLAYRMEGEKPRYIFALLLQRLVYRQLLYWVAVKALFRAALGHRQGWNKLERTGTAKIG